MTFKNKILNFIGNNPNIKESIKNSPYYKEELNRLKIKEEKEYFQSLSKLPKRSPFNTFGNLLSNLKVNYRLYRGGTYKFVQMLNIDKLAVQDYIFPTKFDASCEVASWLFKTGGTLRVNIKEILEKEEESYHNMLKNGRRIIDKYWKDILELTGEDLSWLHQTHGIDCSIVEDYFNKELTDNQFSDYQKSYELHKSTGLKGYKPKTISALTQ